MIKKVKDGVLLTVKILPNSSKNEIIKTEEGLKVKITAQPIEGKANKALIEFLSKCPQDARCTFDFGNALQVVYDEGTNNVDFH